jgi:hypothetical protein
MSDNCSNFNFCDVILKDGIILEKMEGSPEEVESLPLEVLVVFL